MKTFIKTFIALFGLLSSLYSYASTIEVSGSRGTIDLAPYSFHFPTKDRNLKVDDVVSQNWQLLPTGANFGLADEIHWLKFEFENISNDTIEKVLYFPYHHINKIDIYQYTEKTLKQIAFTGTYHNYYDKDIQSRAYPVFIKLPPGNSAIILKLEHLYLPLRASVFLLSEKIARSTISQNETTIWFWRGIFMFALFISIILYISTRIKLFLYYFLLNLGVALFIGMELGDYFMFFNADPYNFILDIKHLGNFLVILLFPLFLNELTPFSTLRPRLWKWMLYGIFVMPVLWAICLIPAVKDSYFLYVTTHYFIYFTSIVLLLQLYFLIVALKHKKRNAMALFITYFFYITAVTVNVILPNLGMTGENLLVYNTLMYGSIFEIFTFMFLMGRETLSIYKERALLLEKQKDHQGEIIKAIVESQEIERNKVGRELHDMVGANISVIKQNIDKANKSLLAVVDSTVEAIRNLSHGLVTPLIKDDEFADEITELCIMFSNGNFEARSLFHNWKGMDNPETATHLFRIVQELLQNAVKHSKSRRATVQFLIDEGKDLTLMYEDNGKGFNHLLNRKTGLGLINIENRVKLIGGSIQFDSMANGKGTTIIVEVPKSKYSGKYNSIGTN